MRADGVSSNGGLPPAVSSTGEYLDPAADMGAQQLTRRDSFEVSPAATPISCAGLMSMLGHLCMAWGQAVIRLLEDRVLCADGAVAAAAPCLDAVM